MIRGFFSWVTEHKAVTLLSVVLFSFVIATIAVAVEKNNMQDDLDVCYERLTEATRPTEATPTSTTVEAGGPNNTAVFYRLPSGMIPLTYNIRLHPDLEESTFQGRIQILAKASTTLDEVVLHSYGLTIESIVLKTGDTNIVVTYAVSNDDRELLIISPERQLLAGEYNIDINYSGSLAGIIGFYASTVDEDKKIATSKFEPTYARQAFPCFDEPAMKAKFSVELVRPKNEGYITLSNMDILEKDIVVEGSTDLVMDRFSESVPMSTYLACFIVCDFTFREETVNANSIGHDFPFRVYATAKQLPNVEFPLQVGVSVTEYYIQYFKLSYPLPKLDMIAIPDFVSGAMEHWGLVTFRETNLLYDEKTTSPANKQNIARVVAHEISHMWFGNMVTMDWWNELWLNEGFASYMQYKALDAIMPEWGTVEQFGYANTHSVLALDATLNSHPIVQTVSTPDEITAIFDSISYNKGAAILRMLEGFVGEEDFQNGVSAYLTRYQYKNTITQNLLDELDAIFGPKNPSLNLTYIMDTWTRQMGYPVVEVVQEDDTTYTLTQKRFLANPDTKPNSTSAYNDRWFIPITYTTNLAAESKIVWFSDKVDSIELKINAGEKLVKLNNDQVGYYRVDYPPTIWSDITKELSNADTKLTISDKANILNDVFNLAEASEVSFDTALDISLYLKNENAYVPWAVAASQFSGLKRILFNSIGFLNYKAYVRGLLETAYTYVTWEDDAKDEHLKSLLRSVILSLACSMGNEDCLENAREKFKTWIDAKVEGTADVDINPNIKSVVYFYGIETNGETQWTQLWDVYMEESDAQEKSKFLQALAASKDPSILQRYLTLAWDEKNVRGQDYFSVLQYIAANPAGTALVWDFWRDSWEDIVDRFTLNNRVLGTTLPAITRSFATQYKLEEMETFFAKYPEAGAGIAAREQAKETIRNNINWLQKHETTVRTWLENQLKP